MIWGEAMAEADDQDLSSAAAGLRHRSSRTPGQLRAALDAWMVSALPAGADPRVLSVSATAANGQSSETVLFEAEWADGGERRGERLVARLAPAAGDVPVFPAYDLGRQYDTIRAVGERSPVPVPPLHWYEPDARPLGTPFFVMGHVDGQIPPDVMPYTFGDNWLADAADGDRSVLQRSVVQILADLHAIDDAETVFAGLRPDGPGDTPLARRVAQARAWYEFAARDCGRSPLVERGFAWLDGRWPDDPGPTVLSWGDARIGNVIFRGFRPAAVLDWEMATLGPRELDLAWLIYSHRIFQGFAELFERPGLPGFLQADAVAGEYARLTGHDVRDLEPYLAFAALQWAIVFLRIGTRQVHFGERDRPDDVDDLLHNRDSLEAILAGSDRP
jgi:aminoglycoside phosphotransferase (APT) family kinase protein